MPAPVRSVLALLVFATAAPLRSAPPAPALAPGQHLDVRQGERVYQAQCARCHDPGLNGAPKLTEPSAWRSAAVEPLSTLTAHAKNGFLQMPAQDRPTEFSEQDMADAVLYILDRIGAGR